MKKVLIINGVNLGELGTREIQIYGSQSFDAYLNELRTQFSGVQIDFFQSDSSEEIVKQLLNSKHYDGIILNPGAYTHTSIVIADAIKAISVPVIEVHISNLFGREQYRKNSFISAACIGSISGFGYKSYKLGINYFLD
ncbi:MAG: 3-dehydroquinate dehydratase [Bacteroidetes bacterium]|nr:3-dehydroquinate dehydratase [Bacteroidota bacterium]